MNTTEILHIWFSDNSIRMEIGFWLLIAIVIITIVILLVRFKPGRGLFYNEVELNIVLGVQQSCKIKRNHDVAQIAHEAWTELVTRKAGLMFDTEHDVIVEVYNSWYALFGEMRNLIKKIRADRLKNGDTQKLVDLLVDSLNNGLRPHLTKWQAKFRKWYQAELEKDIKNERTPQEIQKSYPQYDELIRDLLQINAQMVSYTNEIKKLIS